MRQAVIVAGGKGTRIAGVSSGIPKPMLLIAGKPVLEHALNRLVSAGIQDIHLFTGHESHVISDYFGDGKRFGCHITYHAETEPGGSAGEVVRHLDELDDTFLVVYGDTVFNIDIDLIETFHAEHKSHATLFLHPNDHPQDSDLVETDAEGRILVIHPHPHSEKTKSVILNLLRF